MRETFGRLPAAIAVLALLAPAPIASGQAPAVPTFPSGVELIVVDVVVVDASGRPITGLTAADFTLTEDGRAQPIVSFEAFVLQAAPAAASPAPEPAVASNEAPPPGNGRAFAVVLDDLRTPPPQSAAARQAVSSFIRSSLREGDELTLGTTSGEARWSARLPEGREDLLAVLERVQGRGSDAASYARMTDYEAYRIAKYEDAPGTGRLPAGPASGRGSSSTESSPMTSSVRERVIERWLLANVCTPTSCDAMVRGVASDHDARRQDLTRLTLDAVRRALGSLSAVHGRKSLLLVTPGFLEDASLGLRGVAAASREANAAVYFIDANALDVSSGLGSAEDAGPGGERDPGAFARERATLRFEERNLETAGSRTLADDTGGFSVRNTNDLTGGLERIADESQAYYLLGFHPPPGKKAGEWRPLRVEVRRPGATLRARRGYALRAEAPPAKPKKKDKGPSVDPAVVRALDSGRDSPGIPLRAIPLVREPRPGGATRVVVAVELDARHAVPSGPGGRIEFGVLVTHRDSGRTFRDDGALTVSVPSGDVPAWRGLTREFDLPAGVVQARVVVHDPSTGATGAVTARFEVPPPGSFRLSTPVLTDRLEPPAAGQPRPARPRPLIAAHRTFGTGGPLYCEFEVFGAAAANGGAPRVSAGLTLRTADGRVVKEAPATPIAADPDGRLVRLVGIPLEGVAAGPYELVLTVRDEAGGQIERREAFALTPEPAHR